MMTYRSGSCVLLNVALALLSLGLCAGSTLGGDFYWSGTCEYDEWWHECWFPEDYCDAEEHLWHYNNWGYESCQGDPPLLFPGATDNVYLGTADALLTSDGGAAVYYLSVSLGGQLTINGPAPSGTATLTVTGPLLTNDGTIHLGSTDHAILLFEQTATIEGGGVVWLDRPGTSGQLNTEPGATLTNASGHTIRGRGTINAALVNNGTVTSDTAQLYLSTNDKTNNAMMKGVGGTSLYVASVALTQSAQGQLLADGGDVYVRDGATVSGGTLATANGGQIVITSGTNTLQGVTIAEDAAVTVGGTGLILAGSSLTNNGTMTCTVDPDLLVQDNLTLQGNGELELVSNELSTAEGKTLTHASEHTIHGRGTINAALVNNGTLIADSASSMRLTLTGDDKTNNAVMKGITSGRLTVEGITLTQVGDAQLLADDAYVDLRDGATIVGGTLASADGGYISNNSGSNTLQDVTIAAGADVRVYGTSLNLRGAALTSDGTITVNYTSALVIEDNLTLEGSGEVVLSSGEVSTATDKTLTLGSEQAIHGGGDINAALLNYGTLMPDGQNFELTAQAPGVTNCGTIDVSGGRIMRIYQAGLFTQTDGEIIVDGILCVYDAPLDLQGGTLTGAGDIYGDVSNVGATVEPGGSAGTLEITEDYTQGSAATLRIELGGPTPGDEYDVLDVTGTANLDGKLRVDPINNYLPDVGTQFTILTAGSINGQFAEVTGPGQYTVTYNANNVTLTVAVPPIPGDLNGDGCIDQSDLGILLADWNCTGGNCPGDCDGDGDTDQADLGVLLAHWGQGCP